MRGVLRKLALSLAMIATASAASAQTPVTMEPAQQFLRGLRAGQGLQEFREQLRPSFQTMDFNRDGSISLTDLDAYTRQLAIETRANFIREVLRNDVDGDGTITHSEIIEVETLKAKGSLQNGAPRSAEQMSQSAEAAAARLMQADADSDGRIVWSELIQFAQRRPLRPYPLIESTLRMMLTLDTNGDGVTTLEEFGDAAARFFREVDTNRDEMVSKEEIDAHRLKVGQRVASQPAVPTEIQRKRDEEESKKRAACAMPRASEAAKVVLLSVYEADAVSTVTLGSQDVAVGTASIEIEPGDEPLYLVVKSFSPVIWRLSGAVNRVEHLVLSGTKTGPNSSKQDAAPLAGATGIDAERVAFLGRPDCMRYFSETPSASAAVATAAVRRDSGKELTLVRAQYKVSAFVVPSGEIRGGGRQRSGVVVIQNEGTLAVEGDPSRVIVRTGRGNLDAELLRFNPGGVVKIDPDAVVGSAKPELYKTLPQEAGLLQLVEEGALTRNRGGEFLIQRKIRFPAELNGAHSVKFVLLRGVEIPDGTPGHSCVVVEETGESLKGGYCR